jgi:hypothetical protein
MSEYPAQTDYLEAHIESLEEQLAELREKLRWIPVSTWPKDKKELVEVKTDKGNVRVTFFYAGRATIPMNDRDEEIKYIRYVPELEDGE